MKKKAAAKRVSKGQAKAMVRKASTRPKRLAKKRDTELGVYAATMARDLYDPDPEVMEKKAKTAAAREKFYRFRGDYHSPDARRDQRGLAPRKKKK